LFHLCEVQVAEAPRLHDGHARDLVQLKTCARPVFRGTDVPTI
jgi:hypothetical protein